jgi:hypothetical protein
VCVCVCVCVCARFGALLTIQLAGGAVSLGCVFVREGGLAGGASAPSSVVRACRRICGGARSHPGAVLDGLMVGVTPPCSVCVVCCSVPHRAEHTTGYEWLQT